MDDPKSRMPLRRDEDARDHRDDDETPLGGCRVRAWFQAPRSDHLARSDVRVSDVRWERGLVLGGRSANALRFADGYAIVVLFGLPGLDDTATLQGLSAPVACASSTRWSAR